MVGDNANIFWDYPKIKIVWKNVEEETEKGLETNIYWGNYSYWTYLLNPYLPQARDTYLPTYLADGCKKNCFY